MLELSFYRDKKEEKGVVVGGEGGAEEFWLPVRGYDFEYREGLLLYIG